MIQKLPEPLAEHPLTQWAEEARSRYGLTSLHAYPSNQDDWKLHNLIVPKESRGKGVGTSVLTELTNLADKHGARVILSPGLQDDRHGTTSRGRLVNFYKRFGFVENKGRNKDFRISEGMFRDPKARPIVIKSVEPESHMLFLHGGSDFDKPDPKFIGSGERYYNGKGGIMGGGHYGYVLPNTSSAILPAIQSAKRYAQRYGKGDTKVHIYKLDMNGAKVAFRGDHIPELSTFGEVSHLHPYQFDPTSHDLAVEDIFGTKDPDTHKTNRDLYESVVRPHAYNRLTRLSSHSSDAPDEEIHAAVMKHFNNSIEKSWGKSNVPTRLHSNLHHYIQTNFTSPVDSEELRRNLTTAGFSQEEMKHAGVTKLTGTLNPKQLTSNVLKNTGRITLHIFREGNPVVRRVLADSVFNDHHIIKHDGKELAFYATHLKNGILFVDHERLNLENIKSSNFNLDHIKDLGRRYLNDHAQRTDAVKISHYKEGERFIYPSDNPPSSTGIWDMPESQKKLRLMSEEELNHHLTKAIDSAPRPIVIKVVQPQSHPLENEALYHFGETKKPQHVGYVLRSGKGLDFSGAHQKYNDMEKEHSWSKTYRSVEHSDIDELPLSGVHESFYGNNKYMDDPIVTFLHKTGGIRYDHGGSLGPTVQMIHPLSQEQRDFIVKHSPASGRIQLEVSELRGYKPKFFVAEPYKSKQELHAHLDNANTAATQHYGHWTGYPK